MYVILDMYNILIYISIDVGTCVGPVVSGEVVSVPRELAQQNSDQVSSCKLELGVTC